MMNAITEAAQARAGRIAGAMYLITIAPAVFSHFFVHSSLVVPNDATQTAQNIIEHEFLFRIGIASDLVSFTGVVALTVALYVLLKPGTGIWPCLRPSGDLPRSRSSVSRPSAA